ncbi:MAG: phage baseplate assembly protein V [Gammaproteobacteria bacterium]|nr:phage baseplate assembly protein V [Gammaproteobacteria bacterium]
MDLIADINRRLESLIRLGTIAEIDHATARVRVKSGGLRTAWIQWISLRAGQTRDWSPPTLDEQCVLFCPSGDPALGFALVGLYSNAHPAPSNNPDEHVRHYPDGAAISYNHASGALTVTGVKTAVIQASEHCKVDCPDAEFTGNLVVRKKLTVEGGAEFKGNVTHSGGSMTSNGIVVHTHYHLGVYPGGGVSGLPQ